MLTEERLQRIVAITDREGSVSVQELAKELDTSESTIRRDLIILDNDRRISKVRGGAVSNNMQYRTIDENISFRKEWNIDAKRAIGRYAASLISDNDFIYIDAGTTTELLIDYIEQRRNVTFVTNGISHAKKLTQAGFRVHILGGEFKLETEAIVGEEAMLLLDKYNFTKGFFGANGVSIDNGITTPDYREAVLKRKALSKSKEKYILCDSSKFSKVSSVTFADIKKARIITEKIDKDKYGKFSNIITPEY